MLGGPLIEVQVDDLVSRQRERLQSGIFAFQHNNRFVRAIWPAASVAIVVVGVAVGEIIISLIAATVLVTGWAAWAWTRYSLERLFTSAELSQTHAFVGETLEIALRIENRKLLPLTGLQVRVNLPEVLEPANAAFSRQHEAEPAEGVVVRTTALRWYERLTWRYRIPLRTRGYYHLPRVDLKSGDMLGVYRRERTDEAEHTLWIYPEVIPLEQLGLPQLRPQGERRGGNQLFEDPTRLRTIRDYRPGDPLKRVDWKATARRQNLQSRVYDPSSDLVAIVALNVSTLPHAWQGFFGDIFERAVSVAASLANAYSEQRVPVGLLANCTWPGHDTAIRVAPSRAPGQMTRILEALAMADVFTLVRIDRMLTDERIPFGSTLALVTAVVTPGLEASLHRLKRHGLEIGIIYVGIDDPPATVAGSPVHDIRSALAGLHYERIGEAGPWARSDRIWGESQPPRAASSHEVELPVFVSGEEPEPLDEVGPSNGLAVSQPEAATGSVRSPEPSSPWARPGNE